jgi:hypothetical protein
MMSRTQITLESEVQRRARQRASELGVSLAEYVRRLVARDLARPETAKEVDRVFDLGNSGGADIWSTLARWELGNPSQNVADYSTTPSYQTVDDGFGSG